ncbi:hypothetical protein U9M48_041841 [Paspalum notatum var. saurae]|uniref:Uncharacterized protein n=1 Tax=Paspalum notatum var. saurae TaxID=547442 RepID=A0AAQ3XDV3_PASNO
MRATGMGNDHLTEQKQTTIIKEKRSRRRLLHQPLLSRIITSARMCLTPLVWPKPGAPPDRRSSHDPTARGHRRPVTRQELFNCAPNKLAFPGSTPTCTPTNLVFRILPPTFLYLSLSPHYYSSSPSFSQFLSPLLSLAMDGWMDIYMWARRLRQSSCCLPQHSILASFDHPIHTHTVVVLIRHTHKTYIYTKRHRLVPAYTVRYKQHRPLPVSAASRMGSWVRTITTPFRKMLNPQRDGKKTPRHHHHHHRQSPSSSSAMEEQHSGEMERTSQLYGEVMACTYEDVQVMWSMLDKARICSAAAS